MKETYIVLAKKNQQLPAYRGPAILPFEDGRWPDTLEHEGVIYTYSHVTSKGTVLNYRESLHHKLP